LSSESERLAEELRKIRESVREKPLSERSPADLLPAPLPVTVKEVVPAQAPSAGRRLVPPDNTAVNRLWEARPPNRPAGLRGLLSRAVQRLLKGNLDAQVDFNARQVQLDNEILTYIDARFGATHAHYDEVLGIHGRHMGEIDERHVILQEELVAHVHDLVKRIDLVLAEAERGRLSLEFSIRDIRAHLLRLEERLKHG